MRILLYSLFLLFTIVVYLFPGNAEQAILILPFINTGMENENLVETLFTSYFYVYFEQLEFFTAVHPYKILNYIEKHMYNTDDLYTIEVLNTIMNTFQCDFILGGEFKIENGILKISIDIFGKQKKIIVKKNFEAEIQADERNALSQIALQVTKAFTGYNPDTASLIVNTEYPCSLYLNDAFFGTTPKRFILPAGEYNINVVYEDPYFKEVIFQKHINLDKGQLYDLGEIKVLVTYEIKANVEAGVYYNGKKIGVTDLFLPLPIGHDYEIEIVYIDVHNEQRYKKEFIFTGDGKNGVKEVEFANRVKMDSGTLPFSGKVGAENARLPYIFENLETGTYTVKMFLEDPAWEKNWIILDKKVTLNIAETAVVDKSDFIYHKFWGLCFIPGVIQFYNFEKVKGTVILTSAGLFIAGSICSYLLMKSNFDDFSKFNTYKTAAYSNLALLGGIYVYSCIDGFTTM